VAQLDRGSPGGKRKGETVFTFSVSPNPSSFRSSCASSLAGKTMLAGSPFAAVPMNTLDRVNRGILPGARTCFGALKGEELHDLSPPFGKCYGGAQSEAKKLFGVARLARPFGTGAVDGTSPPLQAARGEGGLYMLDGRAMIHRQGLIPTHIHCFCEAPVQRDNERLLYRLRGRRAHGTGREFIFVNFRPHGLTRTSGVHKSGTAGRSGTIASDKSVTVPEILP